MAIAAVHYNFFNHLKQRNELPEAKSILEIGEQNWYGDLDPEILMQDIEKYIPTHKREKLLQTARLILSQTPRTLMLFNAAKLFYRIYFNTEKIRSIDLHGTNLALKLDLNFPHDLGEQFDCIFNLGTAEHVFNVYQCFKSMHQWLKVGGRIYHCLPMHGEIDHGFYNFHPTFYWDLAYANKYKIISIAKGTSNSLHFASDRGSLSKNISSQDTKKCYGLIVVFEKTTENAFTIPQQGRYDDSLAEQAEITSSWKEQRRNAELS